MKFYKYKFWSIFLLHWFNVNVKICISILGNESNSNFLIETQTLLQNTSSDLMFVMMILLSCSVWSRIYIYSTVYTVYVWYTLIDSCYCLFSPGEHTLIDHTLVSCHLITPNSLLFLDRTGTGVYVL